MSSKGAELRGQMKQGAVALPGVFNALSARLVEQAGFQGAYISGAGVSNSLAAFPDIGLLTLPEMAAQVRYISGACGLPLLVDADTGYGGVFNLQRCVYELERAGAAGIQVEDQENPKRCGHLDGKRVVDPAEMVRKIRAAVKARKDKGFVVVARTDARAVNGFDDAVERARLYFKAGADVVFPEALESAWEFGAFAAACKGPLLANMTEFGKSPLLGVRQLDKMGYRLVLFPMTLLRVMMKAGEQALKELKKKGGQAGLLPRMQTRAELYALLGYQAYKREDQELAGNNPGEDENGGNSL